jgi:acylglycerol lipase
MRAPLTPPELHTWNMSDGYALRGRVWRPAANTRGAILYLHGIQSHGGWFEWSASLLAAAGQAVILPDRRGSGLNAPARGDTTNWRRWLRDMDEIAKWALAEFRVPRMALVGVSWGGKLAVAWAAENPERVGSLLLIAPGMFPAVDVGWIDRVRIGVALITRPNKLFPIPLSDPALFTANPAGQQFIAADEEKLTQATARFWYASLCLDQRLLRLRRGTLAVEATMVLAGQDRIIRNVPTEAWLQKVNAGRVAVRRFEAASHTLEFEAEAGAFGEFVSGWGERLAAPPGTPT